MRALLVNLCCCFIPVKKYRKYFRERFAVRYKVTYNMQEEATISYFPNRENRYQVLLRNGARFLYRNRLSKGVKIGENSYLNAYASVEKNTVIGRYCSIGEGCLLGAGEHPTQFLSTSPRVYGNNYNNIIKQTRIGNDVWIGAKAIVKCGITIGNGAIIGAGAVITKDVPPYAIVGGVPARLIRYRFDKETIEKLQQTEWWELPRKQLVRLPFTSVSASLQQLLTYHKAK